jgi:hypothetical protein
VFQYTSTPHSYDPNISFKINRFIVPKRIREDYPGRKTDETLFVFPFVTQSVVQWRHMSISEKLHSLDYPLLFLANFGYISLEIPGALGLYGKSIMEKQQFGDTVSERICLPQK